MFKVLPDLSLPDSKPAISVIFCVNRNGPYLKDAIKSVLDQSFTNFELLIGANSCTDEFYEELTDYTFDPRVKLFRTQLGPLSFTLNFLIEHASADLLVRMDADDVCEPQRFDRLFTVASRSTADVIGSWATLIDENSQVIGCCKPPTDTAKLKLRMIYSSSIIHPTVIFRKSFWLESRGYLGGFVSEDYDLWLRGLGRGAKIVNIPECLLRYRVHTAQVSRSRLGYAETAAYGYRELLARPNLYNTIGWLTSSIKALLFPIKYWGKRKL